MLRINVWVTEFERRRRSVVVAHSQTGYTRGLGCGEPVFVQDQDGGCYLALVRDIDAGLDDTRYRLELALPSEVLDTLMAAVDGDGRQQRPAPTPLPNS